jgi:transposase
MKGKRNYTKEFKQMIVSLLNEGQSSSIISVEYKLNASMINRWRREFNDTLRPSFTGKGNSRLSDQDKEIVLLKKQLQDVTIERDILKKAVHIFSKSDR